MKPSGPGLFFVGKFLITGSISSFLLVCSDFLFLLDSILVDCMFLRICPFLLGYPIFWHIIAQNSPLCFKIFIVMTPFSFLILFIGVFPFFLIGSLMKDLLILYLQKVLVLLIFFLFFYSLIYFCSNHYSFLPSAKFGLSFVLFLIP